ncbi:MAG: 50S ribosomal protein L25 [Candidatus Caenarcaniphilales bacterium]|nr:50S ribosomal protein L25 [Candidatus Caenarcaniphilales bacterium]
MAIELNVEERDVKTKARALRREGFIPATLYGPELDESISCQVSLKDFKKIAYKDYKHLIDLKTGTDTHEVLIRNIQKDYVSNEIKNIEFYKVKRGHKLTTKVALKFIGESPASKMGADIVTQYTEMTVKCLPRDIPDDVEVSIDTLKKAGDMISFADLPANDKLEIQEPLGEIIIKAVAKRGAIAMEDEEAGEEAPAEEAAAA